MDKAEVLFNKVASYEKTAIIGAVFRGAMTAGKLLGRATFGTKAGRFAAGLGGAFAAPSVGRWASRKVYGRRSGDLFKGISQSTMLGRPKLRMPNYKTSAPDSLSASSEKLRTAFNANIGI